jgi:hypothetical protein
VPGNASPVALPELLEAGEEHPVLFLGPWNSCQFDYSGVTEEYEHPVVSNSF